MLFKVDSNIFGEICDLVRSVFFTSYKELIGTLELQCEYGF